MNRVRLPLCVLAALVAAVFLCGTTCAQGDDDDADAGGDDVQDDDAGDDDTGDVHPCEGEWDVIVRGDYEDEFDWVTTWTSKWRIQEDQVTIGVLVPDAYGWPAYDVMGLRTAPGQGYSDGAFPTPPDLNPFCDGGTVNVHVEYAVADGLFTGESSLACPNALGPFAIFGAVTCGEP